MGQVATKYWKMESETARQQKSGCEKIDLSNDNGVTSSYTQLTSSKTNMTL